MQVVKLFDEVAILGSLSAKTIELMHATSVVATIKRLVNIYDIIDLNLEIEKRFNDYKESPPWDMSAFKEMNGIRIELLLFHRDNFKPIYAIDRYSERLVSFFNLLKLRESNF